MELRSSWKLDRATFRVHLICIWIIFSPHCSTGPPTFTASHSTTPTDHTPPPTLLPHKSIVTPSFLSLSTWDPFFLCPPEKKDKCLLASHEEAQGHPEFWQCDSIVSNLQLFSSSFTLEGLVCKVSHRHSQHGLSSNNVSEISGMFIVTLIWNLNHH